MDVRISHHLNPLSQTNTYKHIKSSGCVMLISQTLPHINVRIPIYSNKSSTRNTLEGQIGQVNFTSKSLQNICVLLPKVRRAQLRLERKRRRGLFLEYICINMKSQKRRAAEKRRYFFINFRRPQRHARNPFWRGGGDYIYKE